MAQEEPLAALPRRRAGRNLVNVIRAGKMQMIGLQMPLPTPAMAEPDSWNSRGRSAWNGSSARPPQRVIVSPRRLDALPAFV